MATTRGARRDDFRVPLTVIGLLTVIRIIYLEYTPIGLYTDEAQYWLWAQSLDVGYFSKPPLIAWIIAATTSLCGNGEACVRVASPLLHGASAVLIMLIGRDLGGRRLAVWSAVTYATLPGVFYSATLITTDAPLLFFWAALLWALLHLFATGGWRWAALTGIAGGFGLLAKYAMLFALLGVLVHLVWSPVARSRKMIGRLAAAGLVAAVIAIPNILWNLRNGFATVRHTAESALLDRPPLSVWSVGEFIGNQVAIFGIVLSAALLWRLFAWRHAPGDERERWLIAFSLPVLLAMLGQSLLSQAYGNWAAVAYVPLTLVVVAWLLRRGRTDWLIASLVLHIFFAVAGAGTVIGDTLWRNAGGCGIAVLDRHLGWDTIGSEVATRLVADPDRVLLADDREVLAPLVYYARVAPGRFAKWSPAAVPDDHYAQAVRLAPGDHGTWLLASTRSEPADILSHFETVRAAGRLTVPLSVCRARAVSFYELEGFRGY